MKLNLGALKTLGGPKVQRLALKASKYAPEILTGIGVVGVVASTILIARATTKVEPVIDHYTKEIEDVKHRRDLDAVYAEENFKKDLFLLYWHEAGALAKLYAAPVTLQVGSLLAIVAGQGLSHRRAVSLLGAYKALEAGFSTYRQRVIDEYGEEKDRDYRTGFSTQTIEDPETGKKKKVRTFDPNKTSLYARIFEVGNDNWDRNSDIRLMFLKQHQQYANDILIARGYIFLNEVYRMLGFPDTKAGQSVGWYLRPNNNGDNFVDFGIYEDADVFNGKSQTRYLLDFNVDGVILDLIDED